VVSVLHREVVAVMELGNGIEIFIKDEKKIVAKWSISRKKTTPTWELIRLIEITDAMDYVLVSIVVDKKIYEQLPYKGDEALELLGVPVIPLSEDI